jgi:acyl-CoA thioester hydrolase
MIHETRFLARYAESDQMGLIHHSVAVIWFELGRTEMMAALGLSYGEMERQGWFMPVVEVGVKYRVGAHFEDPIRVETRVAVLTGARVRFDYQAFHDENSRLLYEGFTVLCCTDGGGRPQRIPEPIRRICERALVPAE